MPFEQSFTNAEALGTGRIHEWMDAKALMCEMWILGRRL